MKHIIIAIFITFLALQPAMAQEDSLYTDSVPVLNIDQTLDSCFKALDYSSLATGLLIDKAFPTINVGLFDGTINDSNEANMFKWRRAYGTLRRAFIDSTEAFDTIGAVVQTMEGYLENGVIPIAILNYRYDGLNANIFDDSLLSVPDSGLQLQDVPGRTESPYEELTCFVASPAIMKIDTIQVKFVLPQQLYITNDTREIDYIEVDFGEGEGYNVVNFDDTVVITYDTSATSASIKVRIHFTDNSDLYSLSWLRITPYIQQAYGFHKAYNDYYHFVSDPSETYAGGQAKAHVFVYYSCNNSSKTLKRPFIIVGGYVPPDLTSLSYYTGKFQSGAVYLSSLKYFDNIYTALVAQEYDVVYITLENGHDYIQRNALVVKDIIHWVNQQKALNGSKAKNVMLGVSMGGLVSRYAVGKMHYDHLANPTTVADHDVRVLYSHDSPHWGANVPLGIQGMIRHLYNLYFYQTKRIDKVEAQDVVWDYLSLTSFAGQQMLINNIFTNNLHQNFYDTLQIYAEISSLGCKMVCISDGSGDQIGHGDFAGPGGTWDFITSGDVLAEAHYTHAWYKPLRYVFDFNIYATPENDPGVSKKVFDGWVAFFVKLVPKYIYPGRSIAKSHQWNELDGMPGSFAKTGEGTMVGMYTFDGLADMIKTNYYWHCFIPSISSTAIYPESLSTQYNQLLNGVITYTSNFKRYITVDDLSNPVLRNEAHAIFRTRSIETFEHDIINMASSTITTGNSYNYGVPVSDRIGNCTVQDGAILSINKSAEVGANSDAVNNNTPANNSTYTVETMQFADCNDPESSTIIIEGELQLGDNTGNLSGELVIREGSKLVLKNGANIKLYNNSKLIIEEGAELEIEDGITTLLLDGDNSEIIIKGEFTTHNNVDLAFTGNGNLVFNCPSSTPCSTSFGSNNTISLTGDTRADKVLVVTGKGLDLTGVNSFSVTSGKIELGGNTEIKLDGSLTLNSAKVSKLSTAAGSYIHNGLLINSLSGKTISIQHSKFEYAKHGLTKSATSTISPLVISETSFESCEIGLETTQGACTLTKIRFDDCITGWRAISMTAASAFNGFSDNTIVPIEYAGNSSANLSVSETVFQNCTDVEYGLGTAIYATGEFDLTIACSHFLTNDRDIDVSDADLILTGGNYFHNTLINTLQLNNAATLGLAGGSNNFIYDVNPEDYVIKGTLSSGITSLMINGNYWEMFDGSNNPITDLYSGLLDLKNSSNNSISCNTATRLTSSDICLDKWSGVQEVVEKIVRHPNINADKSDLRVLYTFYPNPASNSIHLKAFNGASKENLTVKAIDVMGKTILLQGKSEFDISQLAVGMYQIIVEQNGHILHKQKLVVSR